MTDTDRTRATVRAFVDALFTDGDLTAVDRYLAEDYVDHDPPMGGAADREGMRATARMIRAGCPDWRSDLHRHVAEGDLVVEHFTAHGTHLGELLGVPATGRTVTMRGINIWRVRDGVITERWGRVDDLGVLTDLGVLAAPRGSAVPA